MHITGKPAIFMFYIREILCYIELFPPDGISVIAEYGEFNIQSQYQASPTHVFSCK